MDLLEKGTYNVQKHVLGCLLDILENARAVYHFLEWKSPKNLDKGIANLLIQLWIQEEKLIGVSSGPFGSVLNLNEPLVGQLQTKVNFMTD